MTRSFDASHIDSFASGAWPLLSWVWGGRSVRGLRSGLALGEFSCCQFLVGKVLANDRNHKTVEAFKGMAFHVAHIQAKRELVNVAMQMLLGNLMIDAIDAALQNSPDAFDAVRADAVLTVLSRCVIDAIVAKEQAIKPDVARGFVAEDRRANFHVGMDRALDGNGIGRVHGHRYGTSTAFTDAQHGSLADTATSSPQFLVFVLVGFFSADIALIGFDDAAQLVKVIARAASLSQPLKHEPCRFLSYANLLRQLQARDALAGSDEQVHRVEP